MSFKLSVVFDKYKHIIKDNIKEILQDETNIFCLESLSHLCDFLDEKLYSIEEKLASDVESIPEAFNRLQQLKLRRFKNAQIADVFINTYVNRLVVLSVQTKNSITKFDYHFLRF
jgi:hypothetical protein